MSNLLSSPLFCFLILIPHLTSKATLELSGYYSLYSLLFVLCFYFSEPLPFPFNTMSLFCLAHHNTYYLQTRKSHSSRTAQVIKIFKLDEFSFGLSIHVRKIVKQIATVS